MCVWERESVCVREREREREVEKTYAGTKVKVIRGFDFEQTKLADELVSLLEGKFDRWIQKNTHTHTHTYIYIYIYKHR